MFLRPTKSKVWLFITVLIVTTVPIIAWMSCFGPIQGGCPHPFLELLAYSEAGLVISRFSPLDPISFLVFAVFRSWNNPTSFLAFVVWHLIILRVVPIILLDYFICCAVIELGSRICRYKNKNNFKSQNKI